MKKTHPLMSRVVLVCSLYLFSASYANSQVSNQLNTGYPVNGIFHGTDIENVQMNNGGLHMEIPISELKGRGLSVASKVVYNSKDWTFHTRCFTSGGGFCEDDATGDPLGNSVPAFYGAFDYEFASSTSTCEQGVNDFITKVGGYTLREPDGTKHHFGPDPLMESACVPPTYPATVYADDGSGWIMQINTSNGSIIQAIGKNGLRIQATSGRSPAPAGAIVDANGNELTPSAICCNNSGLGGTDTLGRTIPANGGYYDSSGTLQSPTLSGSVSVTLDTTPLCRFATADTCVPAKGTMIAPAQLNLPNGNVYSFTYAQNGGGELAGITLPTGGQITYTWGTWEEGGRNVATRTISANGINSIWTYNIGAGGGTVTDPAGKDTLYNCGELCTEIQYFDGPSGSSPVIKTVSTDFLSFCVNSSCASQASLPIRETTTWNELNLVTKTETDWDSMSVSGGTATWRNPIEKRFYDWTSIGNQPPLLKRVHTSYRHLEADGGAYLNANIADLPTLVQTFDAAGNLVAQTQNSYDGGSLLNTGSCTSPGVPNHDYCNYPYTMVLRGNVTQSSQWLNTNNTWLNTTHTYDDLGNLRSTTDPGGHPTTYDYTDSWGGTGCVTAANTLAFPTTVTDALGHRVKTSYYPCTSLVQSTRDENDMQAGRTGTTHTYDLMNRPLVSQVLDASGQILSKTSFTYNDSVLPLSITKTVTAAPDPDIVSTVTMDDMGRTLQTISNDPEGNVTTETAYDSLGRKASVTNPHRVVVAATDGITRFAYDALGRTTDVTKPDGNTVHTDYAGNATTVTDETGRQRRSITDGIGELIEVDEPGDNYPGINASGSISISGALQNHPQGGTQASGTVTISGTERTYQDRSDCDIVNGRFVCATAPDNGSVWISVNGVKETAFFGDGSTAAGIASGLASLFNSDPASPATASLSGTTITLTSKAVGSGTNYSLSVGQTSHANSFIPSASGATLTGGVDGPTVFDNGTVTFSVSGFTATAPYGQSNNSTAAAVAAALIGTGTTGLNRAGSPVTATASGATISITYNTPGQGGDVSITINSSTGDPADFSTGSFCSPQCTSALAGGDNPEGPSLDHNFYVTKYAYDALGNMICVEQHGDASGTGCSSSTSSDATSPWRVRRFTYDSLSRLLSSKNPESGTISYQYDPDSNVSSKTDARGITITYGYDPNHRLTQKSYSDGSSPVSFFYDSYPGVSSDNSIGRIVHESNNINAAEFFSYDPLGRIKSQNNWTPSSPSITANPITAQYDDASNLTSLTYPDGRTVTTGYSAAGRMTSVKVGTFSYYTVPQGADPTTWGYWPTGAMNRGTYGNGVIETTGYNKRLQVSSIADAKGSTTFFSKSYGYYDSAGHDNGDILSIADTLSGTRNQTYSYDSLNRVISGAQADNSFNVTYHYDPWGNMTESGTSSFQPLFDGNNRMVPLGGCTPNLSAYCFDTAGDLLKDNQGHAYTYDVEARIKTVDGSVASYTYGPDGSRVRKDANGTAMEYIYFAGNVIAEKNVTTGAWTDYIFGHGKRMAKDTSLNGTAAQYYQDDHLGTTRIMTDSAGNKIMDCTFNAFGEQISCSPDNASNHYRYTGKERDAESGLDDFGARYYSSTMGRWTTPDWSERPVAVPYALFGDPQSLNLYLYVRNDPVTQADADGHVYAGEDGGTGAESDKVIPGLKPQPRLSETVEVSAGVCVCAGASAHLGPVNLGAKAEAAGAEIKTDLAGHVQTSGSLGSVALNANVGPAKVAIGGGVELSSKDGASVGGQATLNGVGVKATQNGVTVVAGKSADQKVGGELALGAIKASVSLNLAKLGQIFTAMKENLPVIVGGIVEHYMPGAGTPNVAQTPPGSNDHAYGPMGQMFQ
jgi:RHS repeat-associated protein